MTFIGGRIRASNDSKKMEMEDQLLIERKKYATQIVVLKVSSLSLFLSL